MEKDQNEKTIRQIITIFWSLSAAMVIMFFIALGVVKEMGPIVEWNLAQRENLKAIIIILALAGIPASHIFHSRKTRHIDSDLSLHSKLIQFRNSFFIKISTMEALAVLGLLGYLMSADTTFLYVFALLFLAFLINRPAKGNILRELEPDENE
jgi:hypothetical protein